MCVAQCGRQQPVGPTQAHKELGMEGLPRGGGEADWAPGLSLDFTSLLDRWRGRAGRAAWSSRSSKTLLPGRRPPVASASRQEPPGPPGQVALISRLRSQRSVTCPAVRCGQRPHSCQSAVGLRKRLSGLQQLPSNYTGTGNPLFGNKTHTPLWLSQTSPVLPRARLGTQHCVQ